MLWQLLGKDLRIEWRSRARINATLFFALMTLLLFSFAAGPRANALAENAAGFFWLALFLSSVLSLGETMRMEWENGALDGLRMLAVSPPSLFYAKALANTCLLLLLALVILPVTLALYGAGLRGSVGELVLILLLGCGAVSAPGTLHAAISSKTRAADVLLPLLAFPVLVPGLLAAVKATGLVLGGDPMGQLPSYLALLGLFNATYWLLCGLLFGRVIEA